MEVKYIITVILVIVVISGIVAVFYFKIPSASSADNPSSADTSSRTTSTTTQQSTFVETGIEMLKETTNSPTSFYVELEAGRYEVYFDANDAIKALIYREKSFQATNGKWTKTDTFKFQVSLEKEGTYELRLLGDASEVSVVITQTLKF